MGWSVVHGLLKRVLNCLIAVAAVGFALSAVSHFAALLGLDGPLGDNPWVLHVGIFVVGLPVMLVGWRLTSGLPRSQYWQASLRGCPLWMMRSLWGLGGCAALNFIVAFVVHPPATYDGPTEPSVVRGFSACWMMGYAITIAILYSATRVKDWDQRPICPNGHEAKRLRVFCNRCGQPITWHASPDVPTRTPPV